MMDSFVEAQNKAQELPGDPSLFETGQSHAVRFSFIPMVIE
jgi:hypothetical protein